MILWSVSLSAQYLIKNLFHLSSDTFGQEIVKPVLGEDFFFLVAQNLATFFIYKTDSAFAVDGHHHNCRYIEICLSFVSFSSHGLLCLFAFGYVPENTLRSYNLAGGIIE